MCDICEVKPATFRSTADDPTCNLRLSKYTEAGNVSYIGLFFEGMITRKEYHCSVGYKVFSRIFNIFREGVTGVGSRSMACCARCGCDIQCGGSGGEWEEEEKEEEGRVSCMD